MRYLVLTDIHANLEALDACLADARARAFDATLVLGDLVGYGPDPNAVIDRVGAEAGRDRPRQSRQGRVRPGTGRGFNSVAKSAARGRSERSRRSIATGCASCRTARARRRCRGDLPWLAVRRGRIHLRRARCAAGAEGSTRPLCLFGHTHYPVTFELSADDFDSPGPASRGNAAGDPSADRRPGESGRGRPAARRQPARGVRDRRHQGALRRAVPALVTGGGHAGQDHRGRLAGSARAAF